jgi:hypothetical protein
LPWTAQSKLTLLHRLHFQSTKRARCQNTIQSITTYHPKFHLYKQQLGVSTSFFPFISSKLHKLQTKKKEGYNPSHRSCFINTLKANFLGVNGAPINTHEPLVGTTRLHHPMCSCALACMPIEHSHSPSTCAAKNIS